MGLAVGGEFPPIFVGIAEDEINCAVAAVYVGDFV
jgi:hypothetical protein